MKDVRIKITGFLVTLNGEEKDMEIYTYAKLAREGDSMILTYDEPLVSNNRDIQCEITITPDSMEIRRTDGGNIYDGGMYFQEGQKWESQYATPAGPVEMEMLTLSFENETKPTGEGYVEVIYQVCLKGLVDGERRVRLDFLQQREPMWLEKDEKRCFEKN